MPDRERERLVRLARRARPLRLAFLVDPESRAELLAAIEASTCRWGGILNAIVPAYRRLPRWASRTLPGPWRTRRVTEGILETFEPDYVVEFKAGLASSFGWSPELVIPAGELEVVEGGSWRARQQPDVRWGISAQDVYAHAYERAFRFQLRQPYDAVACDAAYQRDIAWVAALFGRFPTSGAAPVLRQSFLSALGAREQIVDRENFVDLLVAEPTVMTPLRITAWDLSFRPEPRNLALYALFDPRSTIDVAHIWNLRALGLRFWPVPLPYIDAFAQRFLALVSAGHFGSQPADHGAVISPAPTISADAVAHLRQQLETGEDHPLLRSIADGQLLGVWNPDEVHERHLARAHVHCGESDFELSAQGGSVQIDTPAPDFRDAHLFAPSMQWVTVITIRGSSVGSDLAEVFPRDLADLRQVLHAIGPRHPITATSEGLIVRCQWLDTRLYCRFPTGTELFEYWMRSKGIVAQVSSAGRAAQEFLRALGGPHLAVWVAHPDLVRAIGKAADAPAGGGVITYGQLQEVLGRIHGARRDQVEGHARVLTERVLQAHVRAKCPTCDYTNWYTPAELDNELRCARCLREFGFPAERPPERRDWGYRPVGPFAIPHYAHGAYTVALAIRFFTGMTGFQVSGRSWAVSLEDRSAGQAFEIDFGLWLRPGVVETGVPQLVFGEAKTFNRFEPPDFARAATVLSRFPESRVVFATLNRELNASERDRLTRLLRRPGRAGEALRGRIIVLTETELASREVLSPVYAWEQLGGQYLAVAQTHRNAGHDLDALSAATLDLHAGWS